MGLDLPKLEALAKDEELREYVKVIRIEDDFDWETTPSASSNIWPRDESGKVIVDALAVQSLKYMLLVKRFRPDRIEILDHRTFLEPSDPDVALSFARDILDGTDLAMTSISVGHESADTTVIAADFSAQRQGHGVGFSILRCADLCLKYDFRSYWPTQILYHAPALEQLQLSFWSPPKGVVEASPDPMLSSEMLMPKLQRLKFLCASLPARTVMQLLANSRDSLTSVSFRLMDLTEGSTWRELLDRIGCEYPGLTSFNLRNLSEGRFGSHKIFYPRLSHDLVAVQYRTGLELQRKPRSGNGVVCGVRYQGSGGSELLKTVATFVETRTGPFQNAN
jgi:hypothetical protein